MSKFLQLVPMVLDPRGRCNRKGLLVLMLVTLLIQALAGAAVFGLGLSLTGPVALVIKLAFVWVAISASIQRLHDTGRSGWWLLAAVVFLLVWLSLWGGFIPLFVGTTYGFEHIQLYSPFFFVCIAMGYAPVVASALWLHFKKGQSGPNRFGPEPDDSGFARRLPMPANRAATSSAYNSVPA